MTAVRALVVTFLGVLLVVYPTRVDVPRPAPRVGWRVASPFGVLVTGIDRRTPRVEIAAYLERAADAGAKSFESPQPARSSVAKCSSGMGRP